MYEDTDKIATTIPGGKNTWTKANGIRWTSKREREGEKERETGQVEDLNDYEMGG